MANHRYVSVIFALDPKKELLNTVYTPISLLEDIVKGYVTYAKDTQTGELIYDSKTKTVNGTYLFRRYAEPWAKEACTSDTTESNA